MIQRLTFTMACLLLVGAASAQEAQRGVVRCANLIYGNHKTSVCFSDEFMSQIASDTNIVTDKKLVPTELGSVELFEFPFAIMTGEGAFTLQPGQKDNLRQYLIAGGFIVASAGCSDQAWIRSFRSEIKSTFPELQLQRLDMSHPAFHTVYDISRLDCKRGQDAYLEGLEIDGKIVLIFSKDGLNDTGKVGGNCCCCGGNEIKNARQINVNLLAYTLTH
jgi:hypothetical protein